ncbi:hypothetical protein FISHEDRAFT_33100, partial [Fistulina hepatica ATCC 64428]
EKVTVQSWARPYKGQAPEALWNHINNHLLDSHDEPYAPYCAIVQSSGMGKSRCIDEFSKTHFVIPINLRKPRAPGFPAADKALYDLFAPDSAKSYSSPLLFELMRAFLCALFEEVEKVIAKHASNPEDLPSWFRQYMTEGQTFGSQGQKRKSLYEAVANRTETVSYASSVPQTSPKREKFSDDSGPSDPLIDAVKKLLEHFKPHTPDNSSHPRVILAFDEAHTLTRNVEESENLDGHGSFSPFSNLRGSLRFLRGSPIFSVFLSTTGKITQFSGPKHLDPSVRVQTGKYSLVPAFTTLGWDQFARPLPVIVKRDGVLCADIGFDYQSTAPESSETGVPVGFMSFVKQKLTARAADDGELPPVAKFAVLAQRLPLEFMSKVYSEAEREQVENHLRVCVSIDKSFVSMVTTNSSEPIVSEAACGLMRSADFKAPAALLRVMGGFSIDKGNRGELIALLLLILARDEAVRTPVGLEQLKGQGFFGVIPFLKALFVSPEDPSSDFEDKDIPLKDAFKDTFMHFNHFVKRGEQEGLDFPCLLGFLARNAAVMCANGQKGIDGAVPMVSMSKDGIIIVRTKTAVFLLQVKNAKKYSATPQEKLFASMDLEMFGFKDLEVPIIRVVFALAGRPALHVMQQPGKRGKFTSYDIWASGMSGQVFRACKDDEATWKSLVDLSYGWKSIYTEKESPNRELQMQTTPMVAKDPEFWEWIGEDWKRLSN